MTKVTIDALNPDSFTRAANRVRKLQRTYANKNRVFVRRLTQKGIRVIYQNLNGDGDSEYPEVPNEPHVVMGAREGVMTATLRLRGEDVMFVEFGAGIYYNGPAGGSPHPLGVELGYTIGSYGQGQGAQDHWFYEKDGDTYFSKGTEATMPMWKADQAIRQEFASIAKSVFSITGV